MSIIIVKEGFCLGAHEIAARTAACLGLDLVPQQQLEALVAERLEIVHNTLHRLIAGDAWFFERWRVDRRRLARYTAEELIKLTATANVVVESWAASNLLRAIPDVLCVQVSAQAPQFARATLTLAQAVRRSDSWHAPMPHPLEGARQCPVLFDLYLDAVRQSVSECVQQVCRLAMSPQFQSPAPSRALLARVLDEPQVLDEAQECSAPDADSTNAGDVYVVEMDDHRRIVWRGPASDQLAIARVEEHLKGTRPTSPVWDKPSLPPGML
jgi:hypothetical protein